MENLDYIEVKKEWDNTRNQKNNFNIWRNR